MNWNGYLIVHIFENCYEMIQMLQYIYVCMSIYVCKFCIHDLLVTLNLETVFYKNMFEI